MKKILKLIGKVIFIDLIVVLIFSSIFAIDSTIKNQSFQCESEGKGQISVLESSENQYVCQGRRSYIHECCSLGGVMEEGIKGTIFIAIFAGFFAYPYALMNCIFILLLVGFFYWKDFLRKKESP